jgi:CubicO group peptidase (beta-lactamase class C family)
MTTHTGIEIGSIVKPITLVALLRLQEMGKLSVSDSLGSHFPQVPPDKRGITLELIARHRAGFPDLFGGDYDPVSRDWIVQKVLSAPLLYAPGDTNRYSNSGYSLLAAIIEQRSGMPYEAFVREHVLRPAGTLRIGYRLPEWKSADLAVGYRADGSRWGTPLDSTWLPDGPGWNLRGNGGMFATTHELAQWYEALFDGKILGSAALEKFYSIAAGTSRTVGGLSLGHAGGNGIFNTLQVSWIEADTHLTIFSSVANHQAERVFDRFREPLISIGKEARGK